MGVYSADTGSIRVRARRGPLSRASMWLVESSSNSSPMLQAIFRAGSRPDSSRESIKIGSPAGRRADLRLSRLDSGRNAARKPDLRRGPVGDFDPVRLQLKPCEQVCITEAAATSTSMSKI